MSNSANPNLNLVEKPAPVSEPDTGLGCLALVFGLSGDSFDAEAAKRNFVKAGARASAEDLVRIARRGGYKSAIRKSSIDRLEALPKPTIGEFHDGRFFVIGRTTPNGCFIGVGGGEPREWTFEEIAREWTGRLVMATRRKSLLASSRLFGIGWFIPVIKRFRGVLGEVLLVSVFIQILGLVGPMFTQVVIDKVLVHNGITTLEVICIGLVIMNFAEAALNWLRTYTFSHTTSRMDAILGSQLFRHLIELPIGYFESRQTGQTVARVRELENIRQFLTGSALTSLMDVVFGLIFIAVMFVYSTLLTMIVLISVPIYALISLFITPVLKERVQEKFQHGAANQSMLVESLSGIQTLKAMAVEPQVRMRWEEQLASYTNSALRVVTLNATGSQLVTLTSKLTTAALLWFGAQAVIGNQLTIGEFVAFNMLAGQINGPVLRLAQVWQDFQQFRLSMERLGDIINTPTEIRPNARQNLPALQGAITLEQVTFRYQPGGQEVLRNLSLDIQPGEVIGVVGRSGSGKSTLTKLLQRLYVPQSGRILIDGMDIALMDPAWLRRQIGVVLQENVLFNVSVRDNIALANPALEMERIIHAATLAGAHEFILEMPHGYDTVLEERGSNLSGGQRQRIAIARALISNPRILILDEATSALDYSSEKIIQSNMRLISQGRTVIIVAHRLSTVRDANRIFVMDKGVVAESGNHNQLLAKNGIYSELVRQSEQ